MTVGTYEGTAFEEETYSFDNAFYLFPVQGIQKPEIEKTRDGYFTIDLSGMEPGIYYLDIAAGRPLVRKLLLLRLPEVMEEYGPDRTILKLSFVKSRDKKALIKSADKKKLTNKTRQQGKIKGADTEKANNRWIIRKRILCNSLEFAFS